MKVINNKGGVSGLALSLAGVGFIAVIAAIFAVVFYSGEMNYKNNDQILINKAVSVATAKEAVIKDQQFTLQNENPFVSYTGPVQYGTINVSYPKTWSAYIDTTGSSEPLEAYFNPNYVPAINGTGNIYALRVEISNNPYNQELSNYTSQQQSGNITISPYSLPKVPKVVGVMLKGHISVNNTTTTGIKILLPVRTNTLEIWTDSMQYATLFENKILPGVSFQP